MMAHRSTSLRFAILLLVGLLPQPAIAADAVAPTEAIPVGAAPVENVWNGPPDPRVVFGVDYLNWWLREGRIPATLTTSSETSRGRLDKPDTRILYGNQRLRTRHGDQFGGIRANLGFWLNDARTFGFEANAFFLERDSTHYRIDSDGNTLLARPYVNPDGSAASKIIAGQTILGPRNGSFVGYSRIELFGEEANLVASLVRSETFRLDFLGGTRFLQMRDRTDLTSTSRTLPMQDTLFGLEDHYRVFNAYYGGQLGLRSELTFGRWSLQSRGTIGLGANDERIRAYGYSLAQTPLIRVITPTGLTVQASNTGTFQRTALNMVASVGINVTYRLTQRIQAFGGYTFLLWDGSLRSGDQIDPVVNKIAGTAPARPSIPFKEDVFWAQGFNVGMTFSW